MTKQYLDKAALDKLIVSIKGRAAKLDSDIQKGALSALHHLDKCGDVGFANRLLLALGKGHRKTALATWFVTFGKLAINLEENKKEMPLVFSKEGANDLEGAALVNWFDIKTEPNLDEIFDIKAALASLLRKAEKQSKVNDPALLKTLRSLAPAEAK